MRFHILIAVWYIASAVKLARSKQGCNFMYTAAGSLILGVMLARVAKVARQPPTGEAAERSVRLPSSADVISSHFPDPHKVQCFSWRGRGYHVESCLLNSS